MLKIGWSTRDVSTNEPVLLGGQAYARISTGSMDPTTVTVLFLENNGDSVIFISGDFTSFESDLLRELKEEVAKKVPKIDPKKIILSATHTHTAPRYHKTMGYDLAPTDSVTIYPAEKYRRFLLDSLVAAIAEAFETRAPGAIAYGSSSAEVSVQRRCTYFTDHGKTNTAGNTFAVHGTSMMYGKTNLEDFLGYEAGLDCAVNLLYTFNEKEELTGAVINVPCPSQCTEHERFTSADFWNEAREAIREKYGPIYLLPQCAAAGDLSPHRLHETRAQERRNRLKFPDDEKAEKFERKEEYYNRKVLGERIAWAFDECFSWAKTELIRDAKITHRTETVPLEAWKISDEEYEKAKKNLEEVKKTPFVKTEDPLADFKANTTISSNVGRYQKVIERYEEHREFYDTEIHVLAIGELAFATCPFELYVDYQHRIQGRSPFIQTVLVQLTASSARVRGYLATEKGKAGKGYSAIPFSCSVSPQGGATLVEKILSLLGEIHG